MEQRFRPDTKMEESTSETQGWKGWVSRPREIIYALVGGYIDLALSICPVILSSDGVAWLFDI